MQIPKRRGEDEKRQQMTDRYLTPSTIEKMKRDLERMEKTDRPKAVEDLRRASEMGDRSENAAYTEARGRLTGLDSRIFALKEKLKYAIPIEQGSSDGRVRIGTTVTVEMNGTEKTYEILGSQESDPSKGRISYLSPLGSVLMGKSAGDTAVLKANGKETIISVLRIS